MGKCKYCNSKLVNKEDYCSSKCKKNAKKYFEKWEKFKYIYCGIIIVSFILIVGQTILYSDAVVVSKISIIIIASTLFILPFGNTTDSLGVKKTEITVRVLSVLLIVLVMVFL